MGTKPKRGVKRIQHLQPASIKKWCGCLCHKGRSVPHADAGEPCVCKKKDRHTAV